MLYVNPIANPKLPSALPESPERRAKALEEFERYFLKTLLTEMRRTVPANGWLESNQSQFFREMLDDALAGEMARSGQFGIANNIEKQWQNKSNARGALAALKVTAAPADKE